MTLPPSTPVLRPCRTVPALLTVWMTLAGALPGWTQTPPVQDRPAAEAARKARREKEAEKKKEGEEAGPAVGRPYRALFGGASKESGLTKTLDMTASFTESYDQNLLADVASPEISSTVQAGGFYSGLVGDLTFNRRGNRLQAAVTSGSSARYYGDLNKFFATDYYAGGGFSARTSRRTQLRMNQSFSYAPVYLLGLFASAAPPSLAEIRPASTDYAVNDDRSYTNSSSGEFTRNLGPNATLRLDGSLRFTHYLIASARGTGFRERAGGGSFIRKLSTETDLIAGYAYRAADYERLPVTPAPPQPAEHDINFGVDFHRALSASRRTGFTFKTGSTLVKAALPTNTQQAKRQFRIIADGSLAHQFGETWQFLGSYKRGTGFVEGLSGPAFTDAWTVSTNGFLSPRADLFTSVAYSSGEAAQVGANQNFTTYNANARLRIGVSRRVAMTTDYIYYFYDFSKTIRLAPGLSPKFKRNIFRVGLSVWVPFARR